jgi:hypothetical protein
MFWTPANCYEVKYTLPELDQLKRGGLRIGSKQNTIMIETDHSSSYETVRSLVLYNAIQSFDGAMCSLNTIYGWTLVWRKFAVPNSSNTLFLRIKM